MNAFQVGFYSGLMKQADRQPVGVRRDLPGSDRQRAGENALKIDPTMRSRVGLQVPLGAAYNGISDAASAAYDMAADTAGSIYDAASNAASTVQDWRERSGKWAVDTVKSTGKKIKSLGSDALNVPLQAAEESIKRVWNNTILKDMKHLITEEFPQKLKDEIVPVALGAVGGMALAPALVNQFMPQKVYMANSDQANMNQYDPSEDIMGYPDSISSPNIALQSKSAPRE